ncbi:pseudaminic acid synthase [Shewanella sp. NFH-SH190041]|uniref:pseudaminic acid synthase n=1 Tax=Shewanella sp. NFH-SH190041 TaxID=2950245 RepID=UPI0021C30687|nr:pseudaminic acid synthase [Shewanella sp. NFH-SH190041]BDM63731.1 pseudaminic acid synthase [Shewanella sp. NFH-SH190041]
MQPFSIAGHHVGPEHPVLVIAELSGNHHQSLATAKAMIKAAADAGVQAIKLQTYTPDTMTLDINRDEFLIRDADNLWQGKSLYQLYAEAMTPWEWHQPLFDYARSLGLLAFSTPFDASAVALLESLEVPCYKIASFENTDHALLAAVASTGKPVLLSTGMATVAELADSVAVLRRHGCEQLLLLKCTSHYPADPVDANLLTLPHLQSLFNCPVGLSDHTLGIGVAVAAVAHGACVVEKHFVLDRAAGGIDSEFSLQPDEFATLVTETERARLALGGIRYGCSEREQASRKFRRSLYISADLQQGQLLSADNVRAVRPGLGLPVKYLPQLLGRPVQRDVCAGTPLQWELI